MSSGNVVDSKIVELSLNNQDFESNAKTSLSTLDKLKEALKFDKTYKNFDDINSSIKNVNTGTLVHGVEKVQASFSALDVIAMRTLSNITDKVESVAFSFIKENTIDQIGAGFTKYADKTSAVQTIMSATAQDFEDQATQMEAVNKQLEKLNWFTDETSYNFVDMTSNIGKFTANQVKLEDAVTAMQGISTWASKSGATIPQASHAMYNLSQAIATGAVKLMDWKSIENANMATAEFKETALEAAVAAKTLTKAGEGVYKTAKGTEVSIKSFNQTLSEGWFTSDVLIDTLDKYGGFTNELHDSMEMLKKDMSTSEMLGYVDDFANSSIDWQAAMKDTGLTMEELKPILERLSSEELAFGRKAFEAAQEAKTFGEAIESVKDAVSTGWMNTFELMFGDYLEAKELWTTLAEDLYTIFAEGGNARNKLLEDAFDYSESITTSDWNKLAHAGLASDEFTKAVMDSAKAHGAAIEDVEKGEKTLGTALEEGLITVTNLHEAYNKLFSDQVESGLSQQIESIKETDEEFKTLFDTVSKYENEDLENIIFGDGAYTEGYEELEAALDGMLKKLGMSQDEGKQLVDVLTGQSEASTEVAKAISEMSNEELMQIGFTQQNIDKLREAVKEGKTASEVFSEIGIVKKTGGELWTESLYNGMQAITGLIVTIRKAWTEVFPPATASQIYNFLEALNSGSAAIAEFANGSDELKGILHGLFSAFDLVFGIVTGIISGGFQVVSTVIDTLGINILDLASKIGNLVTSFSTWFNQNEIVAKSISFVVGWARKGATAVKNWANSFKRILPASQNLTRFRIAFTWAFKELGPYLEVGKEKLKSFQQKVEDMGGLNLGNFGEVMKMFKDDLLEYIANFPGFKFIKAAWDLFVEDMRTKLAAVGIDLDKVIATISNFGSLIQMGFNFLGDSAISAASKVGELFTTFTNMPKVKENLARFKNGFKQAFNKLPELFEGGQQKIGGFIEKVKTMGGLTLGNFGEVIKAFKDDVIDYFVNFKGFDGLKKSFGLLWNDIKNGLKGAGIDVDGIEEKFISWKNTITETLGPHIESFKKGFEEAFGKFPDLIETLKEKFGEFKEKVGELDGISLDNIGEVFTAFRDTILKGFTEWDGFEGIKKAWSGLKASVKSSLLKMGIDIEAGKTRIIQFVDDIKAKFEGFELPQSIKDLPGFFQQIKDLFSGDIDIPSIDEIFGVVTANAAETGASEAETAEAETKTWSENVMSILESVGKVAEYAMRYVAPIVLGAYAFKKIYRSIKTITEGLTGWLKAERKNKEATARLKNGGFIVEMAGAIFLVSMAIQRIAGVPLDDIYKALAVIAVIGIVLAGLAGLSSLIPTAGPALAGLSGLMLAFSVGLFIMSWTNFSRIADEMVEFFTALQKLPPAVDGVDWDSLDRASDLIGSVSFSGLINGIGSIATYAGEGKSALEVLSGDLEGLGEGMVKFQEKAAAFEPISWDTYTSMLGLSDIIGAFTFDALIEALGSMVTYAGEGQSSLKVLAEDIPKISEALLQWQSDMDELSKIEIDPSISERIDELQENIRKITVRGLLTAVKDAMGKAVSGDEDFSTIGEFGEDLQTLAEQLNTWQDATANLGKITIDTEGVNNLTEAISKVSWSSLFENIKNSFGDLTKGGFLPSPEQLLKNRNSEPTDFITEFGENISKVASALTEFKTLTDGLGDLTPNIDNLTALTEAYQEIPGAGGLWNAIKDVTVGMPSGEDFKKDLTALGEGLKAFSDALNSTEDGTEKVDTERLSNVIETLKSLGQLGKDLNGINFGGWLKDSDYQKFSGEMAGLANGLKEFDKVELNVEKVGSLTSAANDLAEAGFTLAKLNLEDSDLTQDTFVTAFVDNINTLKDTLSGLSGFTSEGATALKEAIDVVASANIGESAAESVMKGAESKSGEVNASGEAMIGDLASGASSAEGSMTDAVGTVIDSALSTAQNRASDFEPKGRALVEQLAAGMKNSSAAKDAANQVVSEAADAASSSSSISKLYNAGLSMMEKLKQGIQEGGAAAVRAMGQIVDQINAKARGVVKPNAGGSNPNDDIQSDVGGAIDAYTQVANSYHKNAEGLETALKEFNEAIQTNIDTQPVIRPVLDISDIEVGANAIRDALSNSVAAGLSGNIGAIGNNLTREEDRTDEIIEAINTIGKSLADGTGDTYILDGITYDDGSNVAGAIQTLVNSVKMRRRV